VLCRSGVGGVPCVQRIALILYVKADERETKNRVLGVDL